MTSTTPSKPHNFKQLYHISLNKELLQSKPLMVYFVRVLYIYNANTLKLAHSYYCFTTLKYETPILLETLIIYKPEASLVKSIEASVKFEKRFE